MNQVTLIGTIVGDPRPDTDRSEPMLSISLKTEELSFHGSRQRAITHTHRVHICGAGLKSVSKYLRPGAVVAVSGKLHSTPQNPTYVLAEHLDVLSTATPSDSDQTMVLDHDAAATHVLAADDSTSRVSYDGHTRKV